MALSLAQYAEHLDSRADLLWPAPPEVHRTKSKPHLKSLPMVKAVTWNVYGTLLAISGGEFYREHPQLFIMNLALDKTIQEFKMWKSMSRKPGQPAEYMRVMLQNVFDEISFQVEKGEKYPEFPVERQWEGIIRKLLQNEYVIETGKYGTLEELAVKIAYFFHRSLQGVGAQASAADTVQWLKDRKYWQGILADAQCFTMLQLQRSLAEQNPQVMLDFCIPSFCRSLSFQVKGRKPSERLFKDMVQKLRSAGIEPEETLHISNDLPNDLAPARRLGFITCLYTGDSKSLKAPPELVADRTIRPVVMINDLAQVVDMLSS